MSRRISLITMGQGNMIALKRTFESFKNVVDEFVYGDLLIYEEDRKLLREYEMIYNLRVVKMPFNYIFQMGFSSTLNFLIGHASNNMVLYMNTSEIIDEDYGINKIVEGNTQCNCFYFTHRTEKHRWFRCFDRREMAWKGVIHEEPRPILNIERPYHKPIFMMADTEKDMEDSKKAYVFNRIKEICYDNNYLKLVDQPKVIEATNEGWVNFVKSQYDVMKERTINHELYQAFSSGNFKLLWAIINSPDFKEKKLESSFGLNFQGARKDIL